MRFDKERKEEPEAWNFFMQKSLAEHPVLKYKISRYCR